MTKTVVFKTPGHIDIRAFTVFGMNSKPNSDNPIGYFGTGLKYAVATLVRNKQKVQVWIGGDKYTFYARNTMFRNSEFSQIRMKREVFATVWGAMSKPSYHDLPFTTELGKNWELWQAFRELESNTRDEGGETLLAPGDTGVHTSLETAIYVTGDKFFEAYQDRDKVFLAAEKEPVYDTQEIRIYNRPSEHIYWRGVRVMDLEQPSRYTYDIQAPMELTEDRTLKWGYRAEAVISRAIMLCEDEGVVTEAVTQKGKYEERLNYHYSGVAPSATFIGASRHHSASSGAKDIVTYYKPKPKKADPFTKWPRPWTSTDDSVYDKDGNSILTCDSKNGQELAALIATLGNKDAGIVSEGEDEIPF